MFISASKDTTAKLWDMDQLEYKKTYKTERPVNSASISPNKDHVVLGGGQVRFIHDTSYFQRSFSKLGKPFAFSVKYIFIHVLGSNGCDNHINQNREIRC